MPTLRIDQFRGLAPRFDRRRLPAGASQIARNLRFDSGDAKPLQALRSAGLPNIGNAEADIGNLFVYDRQGLANPKVIGFGYDLDVTAVRGPTPDDQFNRWYWCVAGEGVRAVGLTDPSLPYPDPSSVGQGADYREFGGYRVGIPAPQTAPTATAVETEIAAVGWDTENAITSIALTNPVQINTASEPEFENGQRVRFSVDPDYPKPDDEPEGGTPPENPEPAAGGDGQVWALNELIGVVANVGPSSFEVVGVSATQFEDFTESDLAALRVRREITQQDRESRAYVFTYVSEFDEEGPPSLPSNIVDVIKEGIVDLEIGDVQFQQSFGGTRDYINRIRVYRTVSGTTGTLYLFVGTLNFVGGESPDSSVEWISEPSAATPDLAWSAEIRDPVPSVSLGGVIESSQWYPPPNSMQGIVEMSNGIIAGWVGNTVRFCEPAVPHAWPKNYRLTFPDDVVGCEAFGNTLVVATRGRPHVVSGVDSASMSGKRMGHHAPLIRPGLICDAGSGVIYCSDVGLVWVSQGGSRIITPQFTKETWQKFVGARSRLLWFDNFAIICGGGETPRVLSAIGEATEASELLLDFSCGARYRNSLAVVVRQGGPSGRYRVIRFMNEEEDGEGDPVRLMGTYRSGMISVRKTINFAVGQVIADGYPVTLIVRIIRPDSYPDPETGQPDLDDLREDVYVASGPEPFRMVSGYLTREVEVEVQASHRIQSVALSTSVGELRSEPV